MSCAALSNSAARMAMQQLRNYPHFLARPIALCFVFEPADKQFFAASLLQLGFVLDTALSKTSEPLLAMIRLKWWIDALQHDLPGCAAWAWCQTCPAVAGPAGGCLGLAGHDPGGHSPVRAGTLRTMAGCPILSIRRKHLYCCTMRESAAQT